MIRRRNTSSRLRQKLTLQEEVQAQDGAGGYIRSWQDIAELWVEIEPLSGRERLSAMQLESAVTHRITMRFRSGVHTGQRLAGDDRHFNIRHAASIHKGELLELMAEETPAA